MTEQTNRVPTMLVFNHLNKQEAAPGLLTGLNPKKTIKQQLESINVVNFYPLVGLSDDEIKNYLDLPPVGKLNKLFMSKHNKN